VVIGHGPTLSEDCLTRNDWICWEYVRTRSDELVEATVAHVTLAVVAVVVACLTAVPLALLARRRPALRQPIEGAAAIIYTIPSLALFAVLVPFTGLSALTVVIGLVLYTQTILVRAVLVGLAAVPPEVRDAAVGMGFGPARMLLRVEAPLAIPTVMAGLRVAAVSTIALTTVGAIIGHGGLGNLIYAGLRSVFRAEVFTASVLCVALAVLADLGLVGLQRLLTPWRRSMKVG
jgi:osmoprotectant transport system permease protein